VRSAAFVAVAFPLGCGASQVPPAPPTPPSANVASPAPSTPAATTPPPAPAATPLAETWEGALAVGGSAKLRLVLHVTRGADGALGATFDSVDQGAMGIPVDSVARDAGSLRFAMKRIDATYEAKVDEGKGEAVGVFTQRGMALALTLEKTDKPSEVARPQTPRPPFPYRAEDVTYANAAGGVTLAGTLTIPPGEGPFPAVLLLTGSGAQDRDETLFGHKPFFVIADALSRRGIAVLRVDDRGVGGSTGDLEASTEDDLVGDALAGVAFLKGRKEIDPKRIGLAGHSEGGLLAPLAATRSKDVAFVVLLAGPGLPGKELLLLQGETLAKAGGMPEEMRERVASVNERVFAAMAAAKDGPDAEARARPLLEAAARDGLIPPGASVDAMLRQITSPWFRSFVKLDPRPALAKMRCPALALSGALDVQVPPKENLAAIRAANARIATKELPGLNHLFQTAKTGMPTEYGTIEETFAPAALAEIEAFLATVTAR
jgi:pimeloyl-ACP methyl ester carboxylesterase